MARDLRRYSVSRDLKIMLHFDAHNIHLARNSTLRGVAEFRP